MFDVTLNFCILEIKDLFLSIYEVIFKYDLLDYYHFKVTSSYVDVIPKKGTLSNDILRDLAAIDSYIYVSTYETGSLYARLTPKF